MDEIKVFFDKFAKDFKAFDGDLIASRFLTPLTVVDSNGKSNSLASSSDVAKYFQNYLGEYKSKGVVSCDYGDLVVYSIGTHCVVATVTWQLLASGGDLVSEWRESYNIVFDDGVPFVYATCDY